jgi:hypothetical protein
VIAAVIVFGDHFGVINGVGLCVVIFGVVLFNFYKYRLMMQVGALAVMSLHVTLGMHSARSVRRSLGSCITTQAYTRCPACCTEPLLSCSRWAAVVE